MSANAYEILALGMRYIFAALMVLIVLRAWRLTVVDSARAKKLRRLSPETGIIGEMLVLEGGEKAKPGMRYPVTLEGSIGSGRRADIRIRHSSVRRRHGYFVMTDEGLFIRGHANARVGMKGKWLREATLKDGGELRIGKVTLMLVLTGADAAPEEIAPRVRRRRPRPEDAEAPRSEGMDDSIFDTPPETADPRLYRRPTRPEEEAMDDSIFDAPPPETEEIDPFFDPASPLCPDDYDDDDDDGSGGFEPFFPGNGHDRREERGRHNPYSPCNSDYGYNDPDPYDQEEY